jgi:flagellar biosynthesis protein FlhG
MNTISHPTAPIRCSSIRVFTVVSGTGGVGKTTVVANLAAALTLAGKRVTVVDGDLSLAHLDLLFGVSPRYTLTDFFAGTCALPDVLTTGHLGITLLPAAHSVQQVTRLSAEQKIAFLSELDALIHESELLLVDTGSGLSDITAYFATAAQEIVVVITPERTTLAEAAALVTALAATCHEKRFWVLANKVEGEHEARCLYDAFARVVFPTLHISLDLLGWIPRDSALARATTCQQMAVLAAPASPVSHAFATLAGQVGRCAREAAPVKGGLQFFFRRLLDMGAPVAPAGDSVS